MTRPDSIVFMVEAVCYPCITIFYHDGEHLGSELSPFAASARVAALIPEIKAWREEYIEQQWNAAERDLIEFVEGSGRVVLDMYRITHDTVAIDV